MLGTPILLYALIGVAVCAAGALVFFPAASRSRGGKVFAFLALFLLPVVAFGLGGSQMYVHSEQTQFCLSCHIMAPWGRSLYVDDPNHLAAVHFQNHLVPPDEACYTCHTNYGQFGPLRAKLEGLHHVYVQYFGTPMNPIHLYHPMPNSTCLHCHAGMRLFVDDPVHQAMMATLTSNQLSCVSSGCHSVVHQVDTLSQQKFWTPPQ